MRNKARQLPGLTLVEILLALAITGLLLAAALQVTTSAARNTPENYDDNDPSARTQLRRLLRNDILHADRYRQIRDGVEMQLHSCLDKDSLAMKHLPSTVLYETHKIGDKFWLIRTQSRGGDIWSELVASDIRIIIPDVPDIPEQLLNPDSWGEISESFALNLIFADASETPMRVNCLIK